MLELNGIKKDYPVGDGEVKALRGIDLRFRKKEFVAILGPSGCGKTTLLNIIGGLDRYTEGELVINGRPTSEYGARDWDTYRNHSIGFVFQNYNLIPHQNVLSNVELALTLSGVSRAERRRRAAEALEMVGLGSQLKKKPAQMSGGQMQRVAIARALVNDPDIILADEPTGALDTETSVQVMDILKKVSENHLVIMVTHNPELAEAYATRIIRMVDGKITGDTAPVSDEEYCELIRENTSAQEAGGEKAKRDGRKKKPSMSFFTAMMLSVNNLFTKKGRTILTSFAGSIGIIGIALIYSVSSGTNRFIDEMQESTLASYPITIESTHVDLNDLIKSVAGSRDGEVKHENDAVYQRVSMYNTMNLLNNTNVAENDLRSFKAYLDAQVADPDSKYGSSISGIKYSYGIEPLVYTKNVDGEIVRSDTAEIMRSIMTKFWGTDMSSSPVPSRSVSNPVISSLMSSSRSTGLWQEMLPGLHGETVSGIVKSQYDLVYGDWPGDYDQAVLILDSNNEVSDLVLYALGVKTKASLDEIIDAALEGKELEVPEERWSYEELCGREFVLVLNSDCYVKDGTTGTYSDLRETETGLRYLYNNGIPIKISGIIKPAEDAVAPMLDGSLGYTYKLTQHIISATASSEAALEQLADSTVDVFTGLPFKSNIDTLDNAEKAEAFRKYASGLDQSGKAQAYIRIVSTPTEEQVSELLDQMLAGFDRESMTERLIQSAAQAGMSESELRSYLEAMTEDDIKQLFKTMASEQIRAGFAQEAYERLKNMSDEELSAAFDLTVGALSDDQCALLYASALEFSDGTYEDNIAKLGSFSEDDPASINLYTSTFAAKDSLKAMIDDYNAGKDELSKISYTDIVGIVMSSVTTIINSISYVLIAFVAISLIVSSIMIGVITLISVQERTKEIGILRALGASKKDVSSMFIAETVIIGFVAGLLGVFVSWLLTIPINLIIHALTKLNNLSAFLPFGAAAALVLISVLLTLVAGLIPSGSAARKDPVEALRTE